MLLADRTRDVRTMTTVVTEVPAANPETTPLDIETALRAAAGQAYLVANSTTAGFEIVQMGSQSGLQGRQRPRSLVSRPQQSSLYWALKCILQITRSAILVPIVLAQFLEPPCTDPCARCCGRRGAARLPPIPINPDKLAKPNNLPK